MDVNKLKQVLLSDIRICTYFGSLLVCSLLSLPEEYKIDKSSILNQWFVKIGWFWTVTLLLPLMLITVKSDDKETVSQAIFRLALSSTLWYTSVNIFQSIHDITGLDISGHTFLLTFSNLLINSELRYSSLLRKNVDLEKEGTKKCRNEEENRHLPNIRLSLMVLSILWDFMLLQTALYYHTMVQKAIAFVWAVGSWSIMHIIFYEKYQLRLKNQGVGGES